MAMGEGGLEGKLDDIAVETFLISYQIFPLFPQCRQIICEKH